MTISALYEELAGSITITEDAATAQTILKQLGGANRLVAMVGARDLMHDSKGSLSFKFPNRQRSKPNYVKISLDRGSDTYTVEFGRTGKLSYKKIKTVDGIYADQLIDLFERTTGLYLRL